MFLADYNMKIDNKNRINLPKEYASRYSRGFVYFTYSAISGRVGLLNLDQALDIVERVVKDKGEVKIGSDSYETLKKIGSNYLAFSKLSCLRKLTIPSKIKQLGNLEKDVELMEENGILLLLSKCPVSQ